TAYASLETVKQALSYGAFEYLVKPFTRQHLEDVVARALGRRQTALGARAEVTTLVTQMRSLAVKTRELEEAARREAVEQSLRVAQLSLLRAIGRTIIGQLDLSEITAAVVEQLRRALGYDNVAISLEAVAISEAPDPRVLHCAIRDAHGALGYLIVDNRVSGPAVGPRQRRRLEVLYG